MFDDSFFLYFSFVLDQTKKKIKIIYWMEIIAIENCEFNSLPIDIPNCN